MSYQSMLAALGAGGAGAARGEGAAAVRCGIHSRANSPGRSSPSRRRNCTGGCSTSSKRSTWANLGDSRCQKGAHRQQPRRCNDETVTGAQDPTHGSNNARHTTLDTGQYVGRLGTILRHGEVLVTTALAPTHTCVVDFGAD
jgi:hypothetical protein